MTLKILEHHRRFEAGCRLIDGLFERVLLDVAQMILVDHRAQHGIGLDQLDLRGQKLVGIVGRVLHRLLAEHAGGHLAVDIDGRGRFVNRSEAQRNDERREHDGGDEAGDFPAVAAKNPEVVRQRDVRGLRFILRVENRRCRVACRSPRYSRRRRCVQFFMINARSRRPDAVDEPNAVMRSITVTWSARVLLSGT